MTNKLLLAGRLAKRMPAGTANEMDDWLDEAAVEHGYATVELVPADKEAVILAYAKVFGLKALAAKNAENASISIPSKVSVNKTSASGNYKNLIPDAEKDYRSAARAAGIRPIGGATASSGSLQRSDGM